MIRAVAEHAPARRPNFYRALGGEFVNALQLDARIAFRTDPSGSTTGFTITDAEGVYEAKRTE